MVELFSVSPDLPRLSVLGVFLNLPKKPRPKLKSTKPTACDAFWDAVKQLQDMGFSLEEIEKSTRPKKLSMHRASHLPPSC
jgi:hypothetical protein